MSEALQYYQTFIDDEVTVILSGLLFVFAFQLLIFRWAEGSVVVTATYFVISITLVGGPFIAATLATPSQLSGIYDRPVVWTLLSFLATIVGIACSGSLQHRSASARIGRLRRPWWLKSRTA